MPNWCENTLTVSGPAEELERFRIRAKPEGEADTDLSLARLYPVPDGVYEGDLGPAEFEKYGRNNWYDWCIEHWGTKWDVEAVLTCQEPCSLCYRFESAWAPPVGWLKKVTLDFPALRFELVYDEPMMDLRGTAIAEQGELVAEG